MVSVPTWAVFGPLQTWILNCHRDSLNIQFQSTPLLCDPYSFLPLLVYYFSIMITAITEMFMSMATPFETRIRLSEIALFQQIAHLCRPSFRILDWTCYYRTPFCQICILDQDTLQVSSKLCNWFSLRCLELCLVFNLSENGIKAWSKGLKQRHLTCVHQGLNGLNDTTSYRQISRSFEAIGLDVVIIASLWNLTSISAEVPVKCQSDWKSLNPNLTTSRLNEILP